MTTIYFKTILCHCKRSKTLGRRTGHFIIYWFCDKIWIVDQKFLPRQGTWKFNLQPNRVLLDSIEVLVPAPLDHQPEVKAILLHIAVTVSVYPFTTCRTTVVARKGFTIRAKRGGEVGGDRSVYSINNICIHWYIELSIWGRSPKHWSLQI